MNQKTYHLEFNQEKFHQPFFIGQIYLSTRFLFSLSFKMSIVKWHTTLVSQLHVLSFATIATTSFLTSSEKEDYLLLHLHSVSHFFDDSLLNFVSVKKKRTNFQIKQIEPARRASFSMG